MLMRMFLTLLTGVCVIVAGNLAGCASTPTDEVYRSSVILQAPDQFSPWPPPSLAQAQELLTTAGYTIERSSNTSLQAHLTDESFDAGLPHPHGADRRISLVLEDDRVLSMVMLRYRPSLGKHPYGALPDVLARLQEQERAVLESLMRRSPLP